MTGTALGILTINKAILVIILAITTVQLQGNATIWSIPALVATTFPLTLSAHPTLSVSCTTVGTALDGTVLAIPASHTQTGSILALTMFITTTVTELCVAIISSPFRITGTSIALAATMLTTVEIAELLGTIITTPLGLTGAGLSIQVKVTMSRAIRETL